MSLNWITYLLNYFQKGEVQLESKKYRKLFIPREHKIRILGPKPVFLNCCEVLWFVLFSFIYPLFLFFIYYFKFLVWFLLELKFNSFNGIPLAHDTCLDDLNSSSQGQRVLWSNKLYFAFELYFLFQQDWMVHGGGEQDRGVPCRSCLREGPAFVIRDILERNSGGAVGSAQGQLQVSGTNPSNFIRSWIRPLLDQERGLDFCTGI